MFFFLFLGRDNLYLFLHCCCFEPLLHLLLQAESSTVRVPLKNLLTPAWGAFPFFPSPSLIRLHPWYAPFLFPPPLLVRKSVRTAIWWPDNRPTFLSGRPLPPFPFQRFAGTSRIQDTAQSGPPSPRASLRGFRFLFLPSTPSHYDCGKSLSPSTPLSFRPFSTLLTLVQLCALPPPPLREFLSACTAYCPSGTSPSFCAKHRRRRFSTVFHFSSLCSENLIGFTAGPVSRVYCVSLCHWWGVYTLLLFPLISIFFLFGDNVSHALFPPSITEYVVRDPTRLTRPTVQQILPQSVPSNLFYRAIEPLP